MLPFFILEFDVLQHLHDFFQNDGVLEEEFFVMHIQKSEGVVGIEF